MSSDWGANGWGGSWQSGGNSSSWQSATAQGGGGWQAGSSQANYWNPMGQGYTWQAGVNQSNSKQSGNNQGRSWQPSSHNLESGEMQRKKWPSGTVQAKNWQVGGPHEDGKRSKGAQDENRNSAGGQDTSWMSGMYQRNVWQSRGGQGADWQSGGDQGTNWQSGKAQGTDWKAGAGQSTNWQYGEDRGSYWKAGKGQSPNWQSEESKSNYWQGGGGHQGTKFQSGQSGNSWFPGGGNLGSASSHNGNQNTNKGWDQSSNNRGGAWDQNATDQGQWGSNGGPNWGYREQQWSTAAGDEEWGPGPNKRGLSHPADWRNHSEMKGASRHEIHEDGWWGNDEEGRRKRQRQWDDDRFRNEERFEKRQHIDYGSSWGDRNHYRDGFDRYANHAGYGGNWDHGGYGQEYEDEHRLPWNRESSWSLGEGEYYEEAQSARYDRGDRNAVKDFHPKKEGWRGIKDRQDPPEPWKPKNETEDDELLCMKHRTLSQISAERKTLNSAVKSIMSAMKAASDVMSQEAKAAMGSAIESDDALAQELVADQTTETDSSKQETKPDTAPSDASRKEEGTESKEANGDEEAEKSLPPRVLIGVVRVGPAVRKLVMKGNYDLGSELVAVFKNKPTKHLLRRLANLIEEKLKKPFAEKVSVHVDEVAETIIARMEAAECPYPINISCTSAEYGHDYEGEKNGDTPADLSKEMCVEALAKIRRVRWSSKLREEIELPIVRILMDFANRLPGWKHLKTYPTEVLVHTVMEKLAKGIRLSEHTLSRLFVQCVEVLAEGLVLNTGPGLKDPCEAEPLDVFAYLTPQHAEDLTKAAQSTLRYFACERLNDLLGPES